MEAKIEIEKRKTRERINRQMCFIDKTCTKFCKESRRVMERTRWFL